MRLPKSSRLWSVSLLLLAFGLAACESRKDDSLPVFREITFRKDATLTFLHPDGTPITAIDVEIAEGDSARARGLMQRRSLPEKGGMLFLDNTVDTLSFWMANTPLPLDIIFVGPDSQVVNIAHRTKPFSREHIRSTAPAQFVVEVRAGFARRFGLSDSTRVRWQRHPGP